MYFNPQQVSNAEYIFNFFYGTNGRGWSYNAVCALLGNISQESSLVLDKWETGMPEWGPQTGFGLVQWTPAQKLVNWCNKYGYNYTSIDGQCSCIEADMFNGQYSTDYINSYPMTASQFITSTDSIETLTKVFLGNFEDASPQYAEFENRLGYANYWASYFESYSTNNQPASSGSGTPENSPNGSEPSINTGINYSFNGGINIGNQPTYNWNAKVTTSQINILNFDGSSPGDYYTSAGDHITILDIAGDQQMALIQYPDQSAGIYQQGWIPSSYISQDYMDQTFYALWTNNVSNQEIIFHNGVIAETTLTEGTEITFLYTVEYDNTIYACVAYIDNNGNPESGYVPWSSGTLNMIGPDIPYYAKYGTEAVELTYSSNAVTQATSIDIVDINGISIPNSYTSSGDNILILNVYMEEELVFIEYPDQALGVYYTGFISAENLINGNISINNNNVSWNNPSGTYEMYGISTNDILYNLEAGQNIQYLYETSGGYACILFNNNNTANSLLETGYTSTSNGTFNRS